MRLIYLTGPHEAPNFDKEEALLYHYAEAISYFTHAAENLCLFSPLLYNDNLVVHADLSTDFSFWAQRNFFMIKKSSAMWVLTLSGWENSYGLSQELEYAESISRDVLYVVKESTDYVLTDARPVHTPTIG